MSERILGLAWSAGSFHGWGVFGINLAYQLLALHKAKPAFFDPNFDRSSVILEEPEKTVLEESLAFSESVKPSLKVSGEIKVNLPLLIGAGMDFISLPIRSNIENHAITFQEFRSLSPAGMERAKRYDSIIAGSSWVGGFLRERGFANVHDVPQGVDVIRFHPRPLMGSNDGVFRIFSGGKIEYRKAQDIVIAAFRLFHARHPDSRLVFAWSSPYRVAMPDIAKGGHVTSPPYEGEDLPSKMAAWLVENGLLPSSFIDLGKVPNRQMPDLLAGMDCALFPNRCEGGTNLVAMECMAMGLPTILSANTGHLDLIRPDNCYPLARQKPVGWDLDGGDVTDWGESDVEEILETLEAIYADRAQAKRRGLAGAATLSQYSWEKQTLQLLDAIGWEKKA
jgi:glycosyltransferase involved in cell wall biosynthesis